MAATTLIFWGGGCKNSKNVFDQFFFKFNIPKRSTPKFFWGAKTTKLKERNYSNFTITFPTIWRCASDFFAHLHSKWPPWINFIFSCAKTEKLKSVIIHIVQSHYPPSGNVHVILLKFKLATTNQLFKYL